MLQKQHNRQAFWQYYRRFKADKQFGKGQFFGRIFNFHIKSTTCFVRYCYYYDYYYYFIISIIIAIE
jgi:hypothetical protein